MITISDGQRRARLAHRHRLTASARTDNDVATITDALTCLHSSDPTSVYLSAAARMQDPSITATAAAFFDDRSVIRHHAMRRTLWVMTPETARAAHSACTTKIAATERARTIKLVEQSAVAVDGAKWLDAARTEILTALHRLGSATSRELGREVPTLATKLQLAVGTPYAASQSAHTRVLANLAFDGVLVRGRQSGSWITAEYAWAAMDEWIEGGILGRDPSAAAAELLRHYLARFGPATSADIAWWTGWTQTLTKHALADVDAAAVALEDGREAWVFPGDDATTVEAEPWCAFLPSLDPTTMGWKARDWYLGEHAAFGRDVFDRNGNAGPTIWMDGHVVGGWAQRPDGTIATELFVPVPTRRRKQLAVAEASLRATIGDIRFKVRFPAPMQRALLDQT